jgi:hypothetical protein
VTRGFQKGIDAGGKPSQKFSMPFDAKAKQRGIRARKKARRRAEREIGSQSLLCTVYAICDEAGNIRYIGQTRTRVVHRMKYHRKEGSTAGLWMKAEAEAGRAVTAKIITEIGTWNVSEVIWIERARAAGCNLLNKTRGGDESYLDAKREAVDESQFRLTGKIPLR